MIGKLIGTILLLLLIAAGLSFASINPHPVELNYYLGTLAAPLSLIVVLAVTVGALIGVLASIGLALRQQHETARLRRRLSIAEREIKNLREIPIKGSR